MYHGELAEAKRTALLQGDPDVLRDSDTDLSGCRERDDDTKTPPRAGSIRSVTKRYILADLVDLSRGRRRKRQ